jgi:hypothetical protein
MPTWTAPITFGTGDPLTAAELNEQLRDNTLALKTPPRDQRIIDEASDYTTASTSFVDVDGTNINLQFTTTGGDIMVGFVGAIANTTLAAQNYLDITLDSVRQGGSDGIIGCNTPVANFTVPISFVWMIPAPDAGAHTIKLQWKVSAGTATLWAGAGGAFWDIDGQFWAREI